MKISKKKGLSEVIRDLKTQSQSTLGALEDIAERVETLETNNSSTQLTLGSLEMRMRDMEIKLRAEKGERNIDLAQKFDLSEGRISQIIHQ